MSKDIKITIFTPQDLNHSSFMQTAFFELEKKGIIDCEVKIDLSLKKGRINITEKGDILKTNHLQPKTSYYLFENRKTNKKIYFATDLYDVANHFSSFALNNCSVVFKRNYISNLVNKLDEKNKIKPIGLTFGCQSKHKKSWIKIVFAYIMFILITEIKFDRNLFKRLLKSYKKILSHYFYVTNGRELNKIRDKSESTEHQVFYQVRCFPDISKKYVLEVNNERAEMVKKLKTALSHKYAGGLVPDSISEEFYPEEITNLSTDPNDYLNYIKESAICIYTKGLQNSPARKLPEYLSQGKCIVSERIETKMPSELIHGKHIFYYDNIDECVEICSKILNNPSLVEEVSKNARLYYEKYLDPISVGSSIIEYLNTNDFE